MTWLHLIKCSWKWPEPTLIPGLGFRRRPASIDSRTYTPRKPRSRAARSTVPNQNTTLGLHRDLALRQARSDGAAD